MEKCNLKAQYVANSTPLKMAVKILVLLLFLHLSFGEIQEKSAGNQRISGNLQSIGNSVIQSKVEGNSKWNGNSKLRNHQSGNSQKQQSSIGNSNEEDGKSQKEGKQVAISITNVITNVVTAIINRVRWNRISPLQIAAFFALLFKKGQKESFIGRCFGIARKLKVIIPLVVFKLGVIVTTLGFLTLFSLKSVGIGILLLIINVAKIVGKFALLKAELFGNHGHHGNPGTGLPPIHYHIHGPPQYSKWPHRSKKDEVYYEEEPPQFDSYSEHSGPYGWYDRINDRLTRARTPEERQELYEMYHRVFSERGFGGRSSDLVSSGASEGGFGNLSPN